MTNAQTGTLVLQDSAGDYFLVPFEALEQGRVREEHKAEIERLIATSDVSGYAIGESTVSVVTSIVWGTEAIANAVGGGLAAAYYRAAYVGRA